MKVLIIKTSSLGDIIHTFPALTDAAKIIPTIQFDWVVEEAFAEVPAWHPLVKQVIPIALRRWRKQKWHLSTLNEMKQFYHLLRQKQYDLIIDAQGLIKSAWVSLLAKGKRAGFDRQSVRESLASLFYNHTCKVNVNTHAITRIRQLFSSALAYPFPLDAVDYGLDKKQFPLLTSVTNTHYIVFLHGTTWETKHWPEKNWQQLAKYSSDANYSILLPWGNENEYQRAQRIAAGFERAIILPKMTLTELSQVLAGATATVAVDTGLAHLAAAFNIPTISLYGATDPKLTGTWGLNQVHFKAEFDCAPCRKRICRYKESGIMLPPCYNQLTPMKVWKQLSSFL